MARTSSTRSARISRRLIDERGFSAIVVESEWPASRRVSQYIRGQGSDATPEAALSGFTEFPYWMWRNTVVRDPRTLNAARPAAAPVGFYGMDVYSLYPSMDDVVAYLARVDPAAAKRARTRYACLASHNRSAER